MAWIMFWIKIGWSDKAKKVRNIRYKYRDNLCLLQQYKWNKIKMRLPWLIINAPHGSNFMTILDFFISRLKKPAVFERLFWQLRTRLSGPDPYSRSFHQYGISALVSQTSFHGETSGGVEKCQLFCLFSQVFWRLVENFFHCLSRLRPAGCLCLLIYFLSYSLS